MDCIADKFKRQLISKTSRIGDIGSCTQMADVTCTSTCVKQRGRNLESFHPLYQFNYEVLNSFQIDTMQNQLTQFHIELIVTNKFTKNLEKSSVAYL